MIESIGAIKIFYCYAHEDGTLRKELEKHLSPLKREGRVIDWYDREILPGTNWEYEIEAHLNEADIVLLLISPDFMYSNYCYGKEMKQALRRHKAGKAYVIPIILRPVDWEGTPIGILQALPTEAQPVIEWSNIDSAFVDVVKGIRRVVRYMETRTQTYHISYFPSRKRPLPRRIGRPLEYNEEEEYYYVEDHGLTRPQPVVHDSEWQSRVISEDLFSSLTQPQIPPRRIARSSSSSRRIIAPPLNRRSRFKFWDLLLPLSAYEVAGAGFFSIIQALFVSIPLGAVRNSLWMFGASLLCSSLLCNLGVTVNNDFIAKLAAFLLGTLWFVVSFAILSLIIPGIIPGGLLVTILIVLGALGLGFVGVGFNLMLFNEYGWI